MAKGGRKVYRRAAGNKKKRTMKILKVIFTLVILAALVFLGYSIAKPIFNYINDKGGVNSAEETKPWTPPVQTETAPEETTVSENVTEETTVTEPEQENVTNGFSAFSIPAAALESEQALTEALNSAKEGGYTAVSVTLKAEGGKIYYSTASEMALLSEDAVSGTMKAEQIAALIRDSGFTPVAYVNLLEDNNRYGESRKGAYRIASDDSTWLDNAPANGGKPWLSPFDTDTQSYAAFISNEISGAGFEYVIFDGLMFPSFRNSDLGYIGDIVKSADRYKALINLADIAVSSAESNNSKAMVTVSAFRVISGTEEVFKPAELGCEMIAVEYVPSEFEGAVVINGEEKAMAELNAYEKAQVIFSEIQRQAGEGKKLVPVLKQTDFSQADFSETITAVRELGCESYIISG